MNVVVLILVAAPLKLIGPMMPMDVMAIAEFDQNELVLLEAGVDGRGIGDWVHIEYTHPMLLLVDRQVPFPTGLRLHMNSGESFPGQVGAAADVDHIAWRHPWLGRLVFAVEDVAGVGMHTPPPGGQFDVMTLANGDQIVGFCASIGPEVIMEVSHADGSIQQRSIPWQKIQSIHLAEANIEPPIGCSVFRDGTVVRLNHLRRDADERLHHDSHPATTHTGLGAPTNGWTMLALGDLVLPLGEASFSTDTPTTLKPLINTLTVVNTNPIRLRGTGAWCVDVPRGMTHFRAFVRIPSHLQHLSSGALSIELDFGRGESKEVEQIELSDLTSSENNGRINIDIEGATAIVFHRTGGVMGEVGATIDVVDGVLFGVAQDQ